MDGDGNINYEEFVGTVFKGVSRQKVIGSLSFICLRNVQNFCLRMKISTSKIHEKYFLLPLSKLIFSQIWTYLGSILSCDMKTLQPFGGSRLEKTKDDVESEKAIKKAKRYSKQTRYGDPYL